MHIVCPNCSTPYAIEPTSLGAAGRTVRCARCKTTWFANGPQAVPEMATADTAGEAQEAFKGVIRPDQPLGTAGQEVYTWTAPPGRSILGPGEKLEFRSRFISPPDNAVDVMVRFINAQDPAPAAK
jgi:predicted Zn finger-like uncharacterized protein